MASPKKNTEAVDPTPETDTSLSPAQLAAKRFALEKPTIDPRERAWSASTEDETLQGIANAVAGYDYRYIVTSQYPADGRELHEERQRLVTRGFEAITGPLAEDPAAAREYVRDEPTAEIWRRVQEIADDEWRAQLARNCLSRPWAEHYNRRCILGDKPENRWLGKPLEEAMLAHHGLSKNPHDQALRDRNADRIRSLCRKFRVHPGE